MFYANAQDRFEAEAAAQREAADAAARDNEWEAYWDACQAEEEASDEQYEVAAADLVDMERIDDWAPEEDVI